MKRESYFKPEAVVFEHSLTQALCDSPVTITIEDIEESEPFDPKWDNA